MKLDSGEITSNKSYTYLGSASQPTVSPGNNKPRLLSLFVDNDITFHGCPASYEVIGMCGKGVFVILLLDQPPVSKTLPQHYLLAATTKLSPKSCGFECFMSV